MSVENKKGLWKSKPDSLGRKGSCPVSRGVAPAHTRDIREEDAAGQFYLSAILEETGRLTCQCTDHGLIYSHIRQFAIAQSV